MPQSFIKIGPRMNTNIHILKFFKGRGSATIPYNAYGHHVYHYEGDKIKLSCKSGFVNNYATEEIEAECLCESEHCTWKKKNSAWGCINTDTQQVRKYDSLGHCDFFK